MDLSNLTLEREETSPEEAERLEAPSDHPCPNCTRSMTVGFEEAFGLCAECVDLAYELTFDASVE